MPVQEFTVNMAAWKALPDDLKAIVTTAVREWTWDQVQRVAVDDVRVMKELKAKGIERIRWPEAEMHEDPRRSRRRPGKTGRRRRRSPSRRYDSQLAWLKELGLVA